MTSHVDLASLPFTATVIISKSLSAHDSTHAMYFLYIYESSTASSIPVSSESCVIVPRHFGITEFLSKPWLRTHYYIGIIKRQFTSELRNMISFSCVIYIIFSYGWFLEHGVFIPFIIPSVECAFENITLLVQSCLYCSCQGCCSLEMQCFCKLQCSWKIRVLYFLVLLQEWIHLQFPYLTHRMWKPPDVNSLNTSSGGGREAGQSRMIPITSGPQEQGHLK
jgi:hypothetical protein